MHDWLRLRSCSLPRSLSQSTTVPRRSYTIYINTTLPPSLLSSPADRPRPCFARHGPRPSPSRHLHRPALAALRPRWGTLRPVPTRRLPGPVPLRLPLPLPANLPRHLPARQERPAAPALRRRNALRPGPPPLARGRPLATALRVPHLGLGGRRRHAKAVPPGPVPPQEPLHPAPGRGGARLGPRGAGGLRGRAPGPRQGPQRARGREGQPRHLPRPHHGHHHAPRRRRLPVGGRPWTGCRLGLVHQPLRLRLPARHPGRHDGRVLETPARPQLHGSHQRHRLESVREGDAGDHRPGALHEEEGRSVLDTPEAGAAHRLQTLRRLSVDGAVQAVRGVPDLGVGQPAPHGAHVLRQLHLLPGGLLPHGGMQRRRVPEHHGEQRPALHRLGQPAHAAPAPAHPRRLGRHARQRRPLRAQVPTRRPSPRQDRRRPPAARTRPARARRLVRWRGGAAARGRLQPDRRRRRRWRWWRRRGSVQGCRERRVPAAWPRRRAAAEPHGVAAVGGELPAEAVRSGRGTGCSEEEHDWNRWARVSSSVRGHVCANPFFLAMYSAELQTTIEFDGVRFLFTRHAGDTSRW